MDKLNQNRNISSEEFKKIKRQFDNLNKQRSKDFTFLKELGRVINKMNKTQIQEFIKNYNNLFLQTVDLLKRNPTEEVVLRHLETRRRMTKLEILQLILPKEILTNVNVAFPSQSSIEEATPLSEENSSTDSLSNINNESNKDR